MKANLDHFKSVYMNDRWKLGFETTDGESWLLATLYNANEEKGVFVDKAYMSSEPLLTSKQARRFANKILRFCDVLDEDEKNQKNKKK